MKNFKQLLILGILLFVINACKKSGVTPIENPTTITPAVFAQDNFGNIINRDFMGQIVDITSNPIVGVTIKIGSATAQTDNNGVFMIKNASVYERFAYITATKTGFVNGSKSLVPTSGTNNIKIMLLPSTVTSTINTGSASNVNLPNGTKIIFDGNFKTDAGTAYNGAVNLIVNHLDPADANLNAKMPGMLFAQAASGDAKLLETYGMVNVQLVGSSNQKLQPATTAQIEFAITASQQAMAPNTIPLWHFDENLGYWIEDGLATKTGNKYIGSVKHFSWWNVDVPIPTIALSLNIVDINNNPIPNLQVRIIRQGSIGTTFGYTNFNGQLNGFTSKNETMALEILNTCGTIIKSQNIGQFNSNTTLPNIVLTLPVGQTNIINGVLKKCDNSNVSNGYVMLNYGSSSFYTTVSNIGAFSFTTSCAVNNFTVAGYNVDNNTNTGTLLYNTLNPTVNIGNITACNTNLESITYSIDNGATKSVTAGINASISGNNFNITAGSNAQLDQIQISGNTIAPGNYTTSNGFQISGNGLNSVVNQVLNNFNITYNLVSVGAVGQYINIHFTGTYVEMVMTGQMMGYNVTHTITGTAHVLRDN